MPKPRTHVSACPVEEGLELVRLAHADFDIEWRDGAGPMEQKWRRGEIGRPPMREPKPRAPSDGNIVSRNDQRNIDAVRFFLRLGTDAAYKNAGMHLCALREVKGRDQIGWEALVQNECRLSKNHAYELVAAWCAPKR